MLPLERDSHGIVRKSNTPTVEYRASQHIILGSGMDPPAWLQSMFFMATTSSNPSLDKTNNSVH